MPPNRCGIEKNVRAAEAGDACRFRIPLIPADQNGDTPILCVEIAESQITRHKIELFEIQGVVWDMHFAVHAEHVAVVIDDHRSVVVHAGTAALKNRAYDDHAQVFGQAAERRGRGPGDRLGQIEEVGPFEPAKVLRAEKLLKTNDLRALFGCLANFSCGIREVLIRIGGTFHLDENYRKSFRHTEMVTPCSDDFITTCGSRVLY